MKKRNRTLMICGIIWAVLAIGLTVLGYYLAGADILAWFTSKWAMFLYVFLIIYLLVIIIVFLIPDIKKRL